ncbi:MAG: hormogonium polysaccharide biosynthesis protein HpsL [Kastovskya adunca ATA6-11-RM4]|jgi:hypothetical protein|nr:hormogonium polysaccharide biosynthesis protein HpsL [Kastovskya adunca ATA6-11-RM4]
MLKSKSKKKSTKGKKTSDAPTLSSKEQLAQKRKVQQDRKELTQFIFVSIFMAIALGVPVSLAVDPKLGVAAGVGLPTLAFAYKYPRAALWAFFIYMPFSGTVTYWIGGGSPLFQLAKDGFYIPALIALVQDIRRRKQPILVSKQLKPALIILLVMCLLTLLFVNGSQQFAPACESLLDGGRGLVCKDGQPVLQGILGLKVFVGYIPLIFCAYYLIRDKKDLLHFTRVHVVLAIICCVLGFMQYMMLRTGRCQGTDHLVGADLFKATLDAKCLVGGSLVYSPSQGMIRLPGTFVAPWQWAWFLIANAFTTFATAFSDPSLFWRIGGLVGMAAVFVNAVISGQRIALALVPTVIVILLILTGQVANLKRFIPIGVGLAMVLSIAAASNPALVQERIDSFTSRWEASPPQAFIEEQFHWAFRQQRGFLGRGLGRATNSTRVFGDTELVETYYPKVLYEVGPFGTLAFLGLATSLTVITFKTYRSLRDKSIRSFGASFWVFVLCLGYNTYYYPLDVDPVAVYYWAFAGVALKLPVIDRQEREKLIALQEAEFSSKKKRGVKKRKKPTLGKAVS